MPSFVTSADGTQIAFDRLGQGPPIVVVSGIFCDRETTQAPAEQLAQQLTVVNYDRRGRGDSGTTTPYAVEREVEDLEALVNEVGGTAAVLLEGQDHGASADVVAPVVAQFVMTTGQPPAVGA